MNILRLFFWKNKSKQLEQRSQKCQRTKELKRHFQDPNAVIEIKKGCVCQCLLFQRQKEILNLLQQMKDAKQQPIAKKRDVSSCE